MLFRVSTAGRRWNSPRGSMQNPLKIFSFIFTIIQRLPKLGKPIWFHASCPDSVKGDNFFRRPSNEYIIAGESHNWNMQLSKSLKKFQWRHRGEVDTGFHYVMQWLCNIVPKGLIALWMHFFTIIRMNLSKKGVTIWRDVAQKKALPPAHLPENKYFVMLTLIFLMIQNIPHET